MAGPASHIRTFAIAGGLALAWAGAASAIILPDGLKGSGMEQSYGSYAPQGACANGVRIVLGDGGVNFTANGRTVTQRRIDYAASYMGARYEGIALVFFPFPASESDLGPLLLIVNDGETRGVLRVESNLGRGQRLDPFHAAFVRAGLFTRCKGTAPAGATEPPPATPAQAAPATPAEWASLPGLVGKYPGENGRDSIDLFDRGAIAAALRTRLGTRMAVLRRNLAVVTPLRRQGNVYFLSGNATHQGGVEQAYVLIDASRRAVQVGLWEKGKLTVHAPAGGSRLPVPAEIATMLANSPPETAVALPGTPWELVPVTGRAPIAYVSAAASPNIESLSLYCETGRPYMAMLLNKPARTPTLTMSWNFAGRLVDIPMRRANAGGTQWIGSVTGTPLVALLTRQRGTAMLRLNGALEGEASLANATTTLRAALRPCLRM
jgi:hypothetical protein